MSIIAHEFFHNWNGDILRPADDSFMWFTEGATVYFSYSVLLNAGIISEAQYASAGSAIKDRFERNPLRGSVHLSRAGNSDLSDREMVNLLYDGGYLATKALDEKIRSLTGGDTGLIDIIRMLYREDSGGREIGVVELRDAILAGTGADLSLLIDDLLRDPVPDADVDVSS